MKKTIAIVPLLLLASMLTLLVGCNRSTGAEEPTLTEGKPSLTFTLQMPQGEPVTYRSAIHDQPEWTVKSLTMYQFNADGSKLLSIDKIDIAKLQPTGEAEYSYTKDFDPDKVGTTSRFLFVANDEIDGVTEGMSRADFEKLLMTKQLNENGTSKDILTGTDPNYTIPMSGVAKQGNTELIALAGTNKGTTVVLTRAVARVDVSNHVPNLTITKLYVENTYDRTTTFPTKDTAGEPTYQAPAGAQKVTMSAGFADLPNPFTGIAGAEGKELKKAIYLYEGPQPEDVAQLADATTVIVEGKLANGKEVKYRIPFVRSSETYTPVTVKRNYLYRIILGDNSPLEPGSKLVFTIEDTPWNAVLLNHHMPAIDVELMRHVTNSTLKYDYLHHTLYTRYLDAEDNYVFQLSTRFKDHTAYTVTPINDAAKRMKCVVRTEKEFEQEQLLIDIRYQDDLDNRDEKRVAEFAITSDAAPDVKCILTIVYDKDYSNPDFKK